MFRSLSSSSSTSVSVRVAPGIILPVFDMAPAVVLKAVENAASVVSGATDDAGEYIAMAMVESIPAITVPDGAIIILPLATPVEGDTMDFTYLAASPLMFVRISFRPQPRLTYGYCLAYSDGTADMALPIGAAIKFPSVANYLVAKPELVTLLRDATSPSMRAPIGDTAPAKRVCIRQQEIGGELAEDADDKPKGTSTYLRRIRGYLL